MLAFIFMSVFSNPETHGLRLGEKEEDWHSAQSGDDIKPYNRGTPVECTRRAAVEEKLARAKAAVQQRRTSAARPGRVPEVEECPKKRASSPVRQPIGITNVEKAVNLCCNVVNVVEQGVRVVVAWIAGACRFLVK